MFACVVTIDISGPKLGPVTVNSTRASPKAFPLYHSTHLAHRTLSKGLMYPGAYPLLEEDLRLQIHNFPNFFLPLSSIP